MADDEDRWNECTVVFLETSYVSQISNMRIQSYLESLHIRPISSEIELLRLLEERHGSVASRFLERLQEETSSSGGGAPAGSYLPDKYSLKNATYDLSLDVSRYRWGEYYEKVIAALELLDLGDPKTILDIGCDNGLLTCYLGLKYPSATVIGIDVSPQAVSGAREHSERHAVENVTFEVCDIRDMGSLEGARQFDLVTALLVFNEVCRFPAIERDRPIGWTYKDWATPQAESELIEPLTILHDRMSVDGKLVSLERCTAALPLIWWVNQLSLSNWESKYLTRIQFSELGEPQIMPLILAASRPETPQIFPDQIIAGYEGKTVNDYVDEIREEARSRLFRKKRYETNFAKDIFDEFKSDKTLKVLEIEYPRQNAHARYEVSVSGGLVFFAHYTTLGFSEIHIDKAKKRLDYYDILIESAKHANMDGRPYRWIK